MRILKPTSNYLRNQAYKKLIFMTLCIAAFIVVYLSLVPSLPFFVSFGNYEILRATVFVLPLIGAMGWWREYQHYRRGYEGERTLTKLLRSANLPDDYHLINDFSTANSYGNIDHIVLSPRGIFAIETKNFRGRISSYGDFWSIRAAGKKWQNSEFGSPSAQAKMNAKTLKAIIESMEPFQSTRIWVTPVVFLANLDSDYVDLAPNESTVAVKKVHELPQFLTGYESISNVYKSSFSLHEIELIGAELLRLSS